MIQSGKVVKTVLDILAFGIELTPIALQFIEAIRSQGSLSDEELMFIAKQQFAQNEIDLIAHLIAVQEAALQERVKGYIAASEGENGTNDSGNTAGVGEAGASAS